MREEVTSMIEDINLVEKKDIQASKLSGGMKRKLRYVTNQNRLMANHCPCVEDMKY